MIESSLSCYLKRLPLLGRSTALLLASVAFMAMPLLALADAKPATPATKAPAAEAVFQAYPVELGEAGLKLWPERLIKRPTPSTEAPRYTVKLLPRSNQVLLEFPFAELKPNVGQGFLINQQDLEKVEFSEVKGPLINVVRVYLTLAPTSSISSARSWQAGSQGELAFPFAVATTPITTKPPAKTTPTTPPDLSETKPTSSNLLKETQTPAISASKTEAAPKDRTPIEALETDEKYLLIKAAANSATPLKVKQQFYLKTPNRFVVDLQPAQVTKNLFNLPANTTSLPSSGVAQWNGWTVKVSQNQADVVRVVVETDTELTFNVLANATTPNSLLLQPTKASGGFWNFGASKKLATLSKIELSPYQAATATKQTVKVRLAANQAIEYKSQQETPTRLVLNLPNVSAANQPMGFNVASFPYLNAVTHVQAAKGSSVIFDAKYPISDVRTTPNTQNKTLDMTFVITQPTPKPTVIASKRTRPLVVIDAGHGGKDQGTSKAGVLEKDLTLATLKLLKPELQKLGLDVVMTRDKDVFLELAEISAIANANKPDAFVSVHYNSSTNDAINGLETYYYHDYSLPLANKVHARLTQSLSGDKDRFVRQARFYVINHTEAPSILVELGYVSNDAERSRLVDAKRQKQAAEAIAKGVYDYLQSLKK